LARFSAGKIFYVDGEVEGTVEALEHKLTSADGTVRATIKAREVVALGPSTECGGTDRLKSARTPN